MDLTKEAIDRILQLGKIEQFTIDGREYTSKNILPVYDPFVENIDVNTLTGFVNYILESKDFNKDEVMIHIVDHATVRLFSSLTGNFKQREIYLTVGAEMYKNNFNFGNYYDVERFIISLQSSFDTTYDRTQILKIVGNLTTENVQNYNDDGVTQQVTAKIGIARVDDIEVPNPVKLKPYRTFREIEQPESEFVFRLKSGGDGIKPSCALFEADGSGWMLTAIQSIRTFLNDNVKDIPIIA